MRDKLNKLLEISSFTGNIALSEKINRMNNSLDSGNYMLAFMGQFSSGKSMLINNLLGKKILPVHITETTALITYIEYGEDEHAEIVYKDGRSEQCPTDAILDIWQNERSAENINDMSFIRIFVNSMLLSKGLIIADTPGINTVFQLHVEQTVNLLECADRIVYVMAKPETRSDMEFLDCIADNGLKTLLVRTHMDILGDSDEDPEETMREERKQLSSYSDKIFFLSNLEDSNYYDELNNFRAYLMQDIAEDTEKNMLIDIDNRIHTLIVPQLKEELDTCMSIIECSVRNDAENYNKLKSEIDRKIAALDSILSRKKAYMKEEYETLKKNAGSDLEDFKCKHINQIKDKINELDCSSGNVPDIVDQMVHSSCRELRKNYLSYFDKFIRENNNDLNKELENIGCISEYVPCSIDEASRTVQNIRENIDALVMAQKTLENQIEELQKNISTADENYEAIKSENEVIQAAIETITEELNNYGDYEARYKLEEGSHSYEEKMRAVGKAADIISILIPGEAWVKGGSAILKAGKEVAESTKIFKAVKKSVEGSKVLKNIGKAGKVIKNEIRNVDMAADVVRGIHTFKKDNMAQNQDCEMYLGEEGRNDLEKQLREKKPGLLDYLSIEYYMGKIGKKFDTPDRIVEDMDYKNEYDRGKNKILNEYNNKAMKNAQNLIKIQNIKDYKEQEIIREQEKKKMLENNKEKIKNEEKRLEESVKKEMTQRCRRYYTDSVNEIIEGYCYTLKKELQPEIEKKYTDYMDMYGLDIVRKINSQKNRLEKLSVDYCGSTQEEQKQKAAICKEYLAFLKEV